jgi:hypothetical protein
VWKDVSKDQELSVLSLDVESGPMAGMLVRLSSEISKDKLKDWATTDNLSAASKALWKEKTSMDFSTGLKWDAAYLELLMDAQSMDSMKAPLSTERELASSLELMSLDSEMANSKDSWTEMLWKESDLAMSTAR